MGQYYHPIVLNDKKTQPKAWVYSHDIKFDFKRADGSIYQMGNGLKLMEHSWMKNEFVKSFESLILRNPENIVWCGDYADNVKGCKTNLYDRCKDNTKVIPTERPNLRQTRFVINHDKKEFVDKTKVPTDKDGWRVHPLPLLTCNSNGRGGGDFRGVSNLIGRWAYDKISVDSKKPKGYKELVFDLVEH
jgi:hypothetical protein